MKVRLLQRSGQNDVGSVVELSTPEGEWLVNHGRAELLAGTTARRETPSPAPEPVRVEDTSPVPEPSAPDFPDTPVEPRPVQPKRGPGRPRKGE